MNAREQRGKVIAETCVIVKTGNVWKVPSQSTGGTYSVNLERTYCSCPDFAEHGNPCKHYFAVKFSISKTETHADGSETTTTVTVEKVKKPTYKQSWPEYNASQVHEHDHFQHFLADICESLPAPEYKRGRPPIHPSTLAFSAIYKVYSTMSARRFSGDLTESQERNHIDHKPHYNVVLKFLESKSSTPMLEQLVRLSAAPLAAVETVFATDSTGFSGSSYHRWFDEKYGRERSQIKWIKLHATIGVKTNVIVACKVMDKDSSDNTQFPDLVKDASERFQIDEMSADKAYTSRGSFAAMDEIGGQFYPAFKKGSTGKVGGSYEKAFLLMKLNGEDYAKHYHQRSNSESTFSALKRKFGHALRAKTDVAMANEALAKVICYNLTCVIQEMYVLGIDPEFVIKARKPRSPELAAAIPPSMPF